MKAAVKHFQVDGNTVATNMVGEVLSATGCWVNVDLGDWGIHKFAIPDVELLEYRGFVITRTDPCPPIPDRSHDWEFAHKDYDGPEDRRCGTAPSPEAAKEEIDELLQAM